MSTTSTGQNTIGSCPSGCTTAFTQVPVGPTGLLIRMSANAASTGGSRCAAATASISARVLVTPSAFAQPYGAACGTTTTFAPRYSGYALEFQDLAALQFGVLFIGAGRIAAPLPWNCTLLCDFFTTVPLTSDANGVSRVTNMLIPPGSITMQAGRFGFDAGGAPVIHMSRGIDFSRP